MVLLLSRMAPKNVLIPIDWSPNAEKAFDCEFRRHFVLDKYTQFFAELAYGAHTLV